MLKKLKKSVFIYKNYKNYSFFEQIKTKLFP